MRDALQAVPGVRSVEVSFDDQLATVEYDDRATSLAGLVEALDAAGYKAHSTDDEKRVKGD